MKHHLILLAALVAGPSTAHAQRCLGNATDGATWMRVGGGLASGDNATSYGVDFAVGRMDGPFGGVVLSRTRFNNYDDVGQQLGVGAGYAINANPDGTIQLCPHASIGSQSGPDADANFTRVLRNQRAFSFGVSVGGVYSSNVTRDIIPFASASYVRARNSMSFGTTTRIDGQDFIAVDAGLGIALKKRVTLRPSVTYPAGLLNASGTFQFSASVTFGKGAAKR